MESVSEEREGRTIKLFWEGSAVRLTHMFVEVQQTEVGSAQKRLACVRCCKGAHAPRRL